MPELIFKEDIQEQENGIAGFLHVTSDFLDQTDDIKISINLQVFGANLGEEMAGAELLFQSQEPIPSPLIKFSSQTNYTICMISQIGLAVWKDFEDCKAQARQANPGANKRTIFNEALRCLKSKKISVGIATTQAIMACDSFLQ